MIILNFQRIMFLKLESNMASNIDKEKFVQIIEDHKWILYKVINSYCRDEEDRKDLEQEIIIQLWKSMKSFNDKYKLSTWLYKIALNVSISYYRSNYKRKMHTSSFNESIFKETGYTDNTMFDNEEVKLLNRFINQLNEFNKEIIILYLEGYSYEEIAGMVGLTESNVGTRINRIKKKIKESFVTINNYNHGTK